MKKINQKLYYESIVLWLWIVVVKKYDRNQYLNWLEIIMVKCGWISMLMWLLISKEIKNQIRRFMFKSETMVLPWISKLYIRFCVIQRVRPEPWVIEFAIFTKLRTILPHVVDWLYYLKRLSNQCEFSPLNLIILGTPWT